MSFSKMLAAAVLGALAFSDGALAKKAPKGGRSHARGRSHAPQVNKSHAPQVNTSSAKCSVVAIGYSEVSNKEAIASVTADAAAYICNGETGKSAHSIATATAEAFALAVATASATCEAQGNANFKVAASSSAKAAANVWVAAYASAFASAGDCEKCSAYASSSGYVEKEVFLKAVAQAEVKLEGYAKGGHLLLSVLDYQEELKRVVVTAFAEALAGAAGLKKADGCLAWANAGGCIYTPEHPDTRRPNCGGKNIADFKCTAAAVSVGAIEEIDAVATASASAAAWTCGDSVAIADLEVTAMALAEATAVAISYAYASCEVNGGFACASSYTQIEETAYAVAYSYASLWAGSIRCNKKQCSVKVDAVAEAVGSILAKAATDAYAGMCTGGGHWTVQTLAIDIQKKSLCALAKASALAISKPNVCLAGGIVYADSSHSSCPAH